MPLVFPARRTRRRRAKNRTNRRERASKSVGIEREIMARFASMLLRCGIARLWRRASADRFLMRCSAVARSGELIGLYLGIFVPSYLRRRGREGGGMALRQQAILLKGRNDLRELCTYLMEIDNGQVRGSPRSPRSLELHVELPWPGAVHNAPSSDSEIRRDLLGRPYVFRNFDRRTERTSRDPMIRRYVVDGSDYRAKLIKGIFFAVRIPQTPWYRVFSRRSRFSVNRKCAPYVPLTSFDIFVRRVSSYVGISYSGPRVPRYNRPLFALPAAE